MAGDAHPGPPDDAAHPNPQIVETHTALLFFVGAHTYKMKKAVDLGFFDQRDRQVRLEVCRREVELNRRLAPDVYEGVVDLVDEDGRPTEHLVKMRRMPEDRRLSTCIAAGEDVEDALRTVARDIAALHERSRPDPEHDRLGTRDSVEGRWVEGFEQLRGLVTDPELTERLDEMETLARRYLAGRGPLFDARIADGRIRDGHGDLRADDIFLLDDGPRILDCIEFGDDYRWGDVLADIAFLIMDLERSGRSDLADAFQAVHGERSGDRWPPSLLDHYVAYRAHIRAKVGIVRAAQHGEPPSESTLRHVDHAIDRLRRAQIRVVLVGGEPGTGKSTLARGLAERLGATVLRTDEIRRESEPVDGDHRHLPGAERDVDGHEPAPIPATDGGGESEATGTDGGGAPGATDADGGGESEATGADGPELDADRYTSDAVAAVYDDMLQRARELAAMGEHVVLDATWGSAEQRDRVRRALADAACDIVELRCVLPPDVADERIRRRLAEDTDASEATPEVASMLRARFDAWPEAIPIDTTAEPEAVAERAMAILDDDRRAT